MLARTSRLSYTQPTRYGHNLKHFPLLQLSVLMPQYHMYCTWYLETAYFTISRFRFGHRSSPVYKTHNKNLQLSHYTVKLLFLYDLNYSIYKRILCLNINWMYFYFYSEFCVHNIAHFRVIFRQLATNLRLRVPNMIQSVTWLESRLTDCVNECVTKPETFVFVNTMWSLITFVGGLKFRCSPSDRQRWRLPLG